jgi:hypothetical protein
LGDRHTSSCPNQISIIAHGELDVCDGEHRWFVMKKGQASDCRSGNARGVLRLETHDTRGSLAARSESPIVLSDLRPTLREKHAKDRAPPAWLCRRRAGHPRVDLALGVVAGARASRYPRLIDRNLKRVVLVRLVRWLAVEREDVKSIGIRRTGCDCGGQVIGRI